MANQHIFQRLNQDHCDNKSSIISANPEHKATTEVNIGSPTKRRRYHRKAYTHPPMLSSSISTSLPNNIGKEKEIALPELGEQTNLITNRLPWQNPNFFKSNTSVNAVATPPYNRKDYLKKRVTFATHLQTDNDQDIQHPPHSYDQQRPRSRKISDPIRPILKHDNGKLRRLNSLEDCSSLSLDEIQSTETKRPPLVATDSFELNTYQSSKRDINDQHGIPISNKLAQAQANAIKLRKLIRSMSNECNNVSVNKTLNTEAKSFKRTLPGRGVAISISNSFRKLKKDAQLYLIK